MTGVGVLAAGGAGLAIAAVRHETHIRPNTFVGDVNLGYLPVPEAGRKIEEWFAATASRPLRFISDDLTSQPAPISAKEIGAELDLAATLARLPKEDFWGEVGRNVSRSTPARTRVAPVFAFKEEKLDQVAGFIEENLRDAQPARARFQKGTVVRVPEKAGLELNRSRFGDAVGQAMLEGAPVALPLQTAAKRVPDEALNRIQDIVGTYGTRFSAGERDRSANIRLAAQIIDGIVLMPGESFSFNRVVGRRTAAGGFKRAGVLVMGRKDYDIGGGICQVSTTPYNAAVLADLQIKARSSHSRPVPYVPIGRDAAVSFPNPDLVIVNNRETPVAFASSYVPGRIEFRVLGAKASHPRTISIVQGRVTTKENGIRYVQDDTLGYGVNKVVESGSSQRRLNTYKVATVNGREVERVLLNSSHYIGSPRIIARNTKAKPPVTPAETTEGSAPAEGSTAPTPPAASSTP